MLKERAKNMIKIKEDKSKMIESASLVIKSQAGPSLGRGRGESVKKRAAEIKGLKQVQLISEFEVLNKDLTVTNTNDTLLQNMMISEATGQNTVNSISRHNPYDAKTFDTTKKPYVYGHEDPVNYTPLYSSKGGARRFNEDIQREDMRSSS